MPNYPLSPMNVLAMRQLMELQEKQAARERLLSVCRRQREETIARQQRTYDRLAGEVEEFRLHDDPQMRAARLLASAETCEQRGSLAAATAYYRLVVRSLPNTPQAAQASSSLERLGVR